MTGKKNESQNAIRVMNFCGVIMFFAVHVYHLKKIKVHALARVSSIQHQGDRRFSIHKQHVLIGQNTHDSVLHRKRCKLKGCFVW